MRTLSCLTTLLILALPLRTTAEDTEKQTELFEKKIRPVLVSKCYQCHAASSEEAEGGLLLDTREGIRRGGDSGHAVVPGQVDDSLIISAMRHESMEMPPDERLPDNVIADFETWIRAGAHDPRDGPSAIIRKEIDFDEAREFWSFRPISDPPIPPVANAGWLHSDIDAFVLSRLESKGIQPVGDASSDTLGRRIYFDLIGLPPSPQQLDDFVRAMDDDRDRAIESLVDHLLDSRHFGERWGRHWLDVVRYAESTGMERNATYTQAWRYRDYVIDALNDDMPFDQFIRQQIAGDLLPHDSPQQRCQQLVATGMLAIGPKSLNENNKEKFKLDVADEQIDVVTRAFLGLTASCARCHDHKFDPIPQSEYYALAGIFTSTDTLYGTSKTNGNRNPGRLLAIDGDQVAAVAVSGGTDGSKEQRRYRNQLKSFQRKLASLQKQLGNAKNAATRKSLQKRISQARDDIRRTENRLKQATQPKQTISEDALLVMAVSDADSIADTNLRVRGEPAQRGREIPRGFLTIASLSTGPPIAADQSGRLQLADWITDPSNPLTARVIVNRVWQYLLGRGIVTTVNNFGANGDRPTHPELLDHLATTFIDEGWSVKRLIRRIMLSHVYQLSIEDDSAALAVDPDNRLLWRMNQRRLEAEAIRDAMLAASGKLDLSRPSGSPVQKAGEGIIGRNIKTAELAREFSARSVYLPIVRGAVPEMLGLFDFPEPSIIGGKRNVTTVPTQALFMMNNRQVLESATELAGRVIESIDEPAQRVRQAYRLTVSRDPSKQEIDRALEYVRDTQALLREGEKTDGSDAETIAWSGFCQCLLGSSEFRYRN